MKSIDHRELEEWLDLYADGGFAVAGRAELEGRLAKDPELESRYRQGLALGTLLREDRRAVRPGFRAQVMASLPAAPWERRRATWWLPAAVLLLAGIGAVLLLSGGGAADHHAVATGLAVVDFLGTGLLAGAGLLSASWRGLGMGLEALVTGSSSSLLAFSLLVVCLDLLVVFMLMRRRPSDEARRAGAPVGGKKPAD